MNHLLPQSINNSRYAQIISFLMLICQHQEHKFVSSVPLSISTYFFFTFTRLRPTGLAHLPLGSSFLIINLKVLRNGNLSNKWSVVVRRKSLFLEAGASENLFDRMSKFQTLIFIRYNLDIPERG